MFIKRDLLEKIKPFLKRKEYISIIGPRQSGKSTFLEILSDYLVRELDVKKEFIKILTFEDRRLLAQFDSEPVTFIKSYMPEKTSSVFYFMIDEFQYAENGGQKLKLIYDTVSNLKIIITGSSSLEIKAHAGRFMVGRMLNFNLYPFNFGEFLRVKDTRLEKIYGKNNETALSAVKKGILKHKSGPDTFYDEMIRLYEEFCVWGGYPAVVLSGSKEERRKVLSEIYNNYILKDIKTLLELATEKNLYLLSQYLSAQAGNIVVFQDLCRHAGLDYRNMKEHMSILEETFICRQVRPFFKNRQRELSKNPKIYFIDTGFRNNIMENMVKLASRTDSGAIAENVVFARLNGLYEGTEKINFWRTKAGAEVDFVLHIDNAIVPIEVKYSDFDSAKMPRGLASFMESFKPHHAVVLTKNYWGISSKNKAKIIFLPTYYL